MKVSPIMNVGRETGVNSVAILPFFCVDLANGHRVLVNYTFGTMGRSPEASKFEGDLGQMKQDLMNAIGKPSDKLRLHVMTTTSADTVYQRMNVTLQAAQDGDTILFIYPSAAGNDRPFFKLLGINPTHDVTNTKPIAFSELGLELQRPFVEVPFDEIFDV